MESCEAGFLEQYRLSKADRFLAMRNAYRLFETIMLCASGLIPLLTLFTVARLAFASLAPSPFTYSHGHDDECDHSPGQLGAVASESSICSRVATDLLRKGGNAADAVGRPYK
jgi:hypothetical protein